MGGEGVLCPVPLKTSDRHLLVLNYHSPGLVVISVVFVGALAHPLKPLTNSPVRALVPLRYRLGEVQAPCGLRTPALMFGSLAGTVRPNTGRAKALVPLSELPRTVLTTVWALPTETCPLALP